MGINIEKFDGILENASSNKSYLEHLAIGISRAINELKLKGKSTYNAEVLLKKVIEKSNV